MSWFAPAGDWQPSLAEALASLEALPAVVDLPPDLSPEALASLLFAWGWLASVASTRLEQHDELELHQQLKTEDFRALQQHLRWPMQALRRSCNTSKPAPSTEKTDLRAAAVCTESATGRDMRPMQVSGSCMPLGSRSDLKTAAADTDLPQPPDAVLERAVEPQGQDSTSTAAGGSSQNCDADSQRLQPGGPVRCECASGKHEASLDLRRSNGPPSTLAIEASLSSESNMDADPHWEAQHERLHQQLWIASQQWQVSYRCVYSV